MTLFGPSVAPSATYADFSSLIVRAIVSRYQGSWELTRGNEGGMVARLALPAD